MKKSKFILPFAFSLTYAIILSLGLECLLILSSLAFAVSLDGRAVTEEYPRFIPFCFGVGFFALALIAVLLIFNIKISKKFAFTKKIWWAQMISAVVIAFFMIKPWEIFFDFLQKTF